MRARFDVLPTEAWATRVAEDLAQRLRDDRTLRLCLPTGDTPAPVWSALVALHRRGAAPFADATVVLLDEYLGLEPGDPARCDARLRRELLDHLDPEPELIVPRVDELPPDEAAAELDAAAAAGLDLALVGLGMNGHVGLNEPGSGADSRTRAVRLDPDSAAAADRYGAGRTPEAGITLGLARLLEARELWLLVTGERKADILAATLDGPETTDVPATFLRRHPALRVIVDDNAAGRLASLPPQR